MSEKLERKPFVLRVIEQMCDDGPLDPDVMQAKEYLREKFANYVPTSGRSPRTHRASYRRPGRSRKRK